jgi:hypothetical protein
MHGFTTTGGGKPEVPAVADAAERLVRSALARLADNGAPVRAV